MISHDQDLFVKEAARLMLLKAFVDLAAASSAYRSRQTYFKRRQRLLESAAASDVRHHQFPTGATLLRTPDERWIGPIVKCITEIFARDAVPISVNPELEKQPRWAKNSLTQHESSSGPPKHPTAKRLRASLEPLAPAVTADQSPWEPAVILTPEHANELFRINDHQSEAMTTEGKWWIDGARSHALRLIVIHTNAADGLRRFPRATGIDLPGFSEWVAKRMVGLDGSSLVLLGEPRLLGASPEVLWRRAADGSLRKAFWEGSEMILQRLRNG